MSERRLSIAVLSRHFDPSAGGAERYSVSLVQALANRHDIHVYSQSCGIELPGVTVHHVPAGPRTRWVNQLWFALHTARACRGRYDIVHSHEATWFGNVQTVHVRPIKVNLLAGRSGLVRLAKWLGIALSPRLLSYLCVERARLAPRPGKAIVAVSPPLRRELETAYPRLLGTPIDIVPPGVTPMPAGDAEDPKALRRAQGATDDHFVLLLVANDHRKKGLPALLAALGQLGDASMHLWVVGGSAERAASEALARQLGVADRVRFLGRLAQPGPVYRAADLLVHPALEDTFGMVVPEAMSQGLPVLVSSGRWCGVADGLRDGIDARLLDDPRDTAALAAAIAALRADAALRRRLADGGRLFAARLDWAHVAEQQERIYRRIAAEGQPG